MTVASSSGKTPKCLQIDRFDRVFRGKVTCVTPVPLPQIPQSAVAEV
jgi:hypothetical protein